MKRATVVSLLEQLERMALGAPDRAGVVAGLMKETGMDWGDDVGAWRAWWDVVVSNPVLMQVWSGAQDDELTRRLAPLRATGLVDEDELSQAMNNPLLRQNHDAYLRKHDGPSIRLSEALTLAAGRPEERRHVAARLRRALRTDVAVAVTASEVGITVTIGDLTQTVNDPPGFAQAMQAWLTREGRGRVVRVDDQGRAWALTPENLAAIRSHLKLRFRLLGAEAPGRPHPSVAGAVSDLLAAGLDVQAPPAKLAWEVFEGESLHEQVLQLGELGPALAWRVTPREVASLEQLTGLSLPDVRPTGTAQELLREVNRELRGRDHRVGAVHMPGKRVRAFLVPVGSIEPLRKLVSLICELAPTIEELVPAGRLARFDAERVGRAEYYLPLVADVLALAGSALQPTQVECSEEPPPRAADEEPKRRLRLTWRRKTFEALLEGNTDWVDVEGLVECLNRLATHAGLTHRFCEVRDKMWGQEAGVAFVTTGERDALARAGWLVD